MFSLRIILPAVILVFAIAGTWLSYQVARQTLMDDAVARVAVDARNTLTLLQGSVVQSLNAKNTRAVQQIVASMAAKPDLKMFAVVDAQDMVVVSTRYAFMNRHWAQTDIDANPEYVAQVQQASSTEVYVDRAQGVLTGYSAICVDDGAQLLRSNQCGFIYYKLSLEYHYRNTLESAKTEALHFGLGLLLGAVLLILAIDLFVTRRVRVLIKIIRDFSAGNRLVRSKCWGRDELRGLGETINDLMDRINEDETELREREQRLDTLFEILIDAIVTIDDRGRIQRVNPATCHLFGYEVDELIGQNVNMLMPQSYKQDHDQYLQNYLTTGVKKIIGTGREVVALRRDGSTFPIELSISEMNLNGERLFVGVMRDVTERKRLEDKLRENNAALQDANRQLEVSALTDSLTGLANRRHFDQALLDAVNRATRKRYSVALFICDVDFFKKYNDHYGHQAGDVCLQQVAGAIAAQLRRAGEVAARYGGEEFAVILPEASLEQVQMMGQRLVNGVRELAVPHEYSDAETVVTLSVGYSLYTPDSNMPPSIESFIDNADVGLYRAKEQGRNQLAEGKNTSGR